MSPGGEPEPGGPELAGLAREVRYLRRVVSSLLATALVAAALFCLELALALPWHERTLGELADDRELPLFTILALGIAGSKLFVAFLFLAPTACLVLLWTDRDHPGAVSFLILCLVILLLTFLAAARFALLLPLLGLAL